MGTLLAMICRGNSGVQNCCCTQMSDSEHMERAPTVRRSIRLDWKFGQFDNSSWGVTHAMKSGRMTLLLLSAIGTVITSVPHLQCVCPALPHHSDTHRQVAALNACCSHGCCGPARAKSQDSPRPCCRKKTSYAYTIHDHSKAFSHASVSCTNDGFATPARCSQVVHTPAPASVEEITSQIWQSWTKSLQYAGFSYCPRVDIVRYPFNSRLTPHRQTDDTAALSTDLVSLHQRLSI
jgi:hypothetical protein